jgi:hypothetical protein
MTIIPLEKPDVRATAKLVKRVFPFQSPLEGLTFWAYTNQDKGWVRWIMGLFGIKQLDQDLDSRWMNSTIFWAPAVFTP